MVEPGTRKKNHTGVCPRPRSMTAETGAVYVLLKTLKKKNIAGFLQLQAFIDF